MGLIDEAGVKALSTWLPKAAASPRTVVIHNGSGQNRTLDLEVRDDYELATLKQILYRNNRKFDVI
jgi:hypothetical protein